MGSHHLLDKHQCSQVLGTDVKQGVVAFNDTSCRTTKRSICVCKCKHASKSQNTSPTFCTPHWCVASYILQTSGVLRCRLTDAACQHKCAVHCHLGNQQHDGG